MFSLGTRESASTIRRSFTGAGFSGVRRREVGTNRGRSLPFTLMSRSSRRLIGAVIRPTVTGGSVRPRLGERDSNMTLTSGRPCVVSIVSTVAGHQRPLPNQTSHTQTGAASVNSLTSDGFIDSPGPSSGWHFGQGDLLFRARVKRLVSHAGLQDPGAGRH